MTPDFQLVMEAPESAFLVCRMSLPDQETLALEVAAQRDLEPGDVKVEYSSKDGQLYVLVYDRVIRIDCYRNTAWIAQATECLKAKRAFDIVNPTMSDIAQLERLFSPFADWFRWSDGSERIPKRRFRPIGDPMSVP
jgi:hypothetical protein